MQKLIPIVFNYSFAINPPLSTLRSVLPMLIKHMAAYY